MRNRYEALRRNMPLSFRGVWKREGGFRRVFDGRGAQFAAGRVCSSSVSRTPDHEYDFRPSKSRPPVPEGHVHRVTTLKEPRKLPRRVSEVLSETPSEEDFSQRLSLLLPLVVLFMVVCERGMSNSFQGHKPLPSGNPVDPAEAFKNPLRGKLSRRASRRAVPLGLSPYGTFETNKTIDLSIPVVFLQLRIS